MPYSRLGFNTRHPCGENYMALFLSIVYKEFINVEEALYMLGGKDYNYLLRDAKKVRNTIEREKKERNLKRKGRVRRNAGIKK